MPYISEGRRRLLDNPTLKQPPCTPVTVGELTYVFTREINAYLEERVERQGGLRYADQADVLAALEGAKLDFDRRILTPYEEGAQERNGDVWSAAVLEAAHER